MMYGSSNTLCQGPVQPLFNDIMHSRFVEFQYSNHYWLRVFTFSLGRSWEVSLFTCLSTLMWRPLIGYLIARAPHLELAVHKEIPVISKRKLDSVIKIQEPIIPSTTQISNNLALVSRIEIFFFFFLIQNPTRYHVLVQLTNTDLQQNGH